MSTLEKPVLFLGIGFLAASVLAVTVLPMDFFYSPYEQLKEPANKSMGVNEIGIATHELEQNLAIFKRDSKYSYENVRDQGLKEFKNAVGLESGNKYIPHITKADNLGDDVMESTNKFIDELNSAQQKAEIKNRNLMPHEETKADRFVKAFTGTPEKVLNDEHANQIQKSKLANQGYSEGSETQDTFDEVL